MPSMRHAYADLPYLGPARALCSARLIQSSRWVHQQNVHPAPNVPQCKVTLKPVTAACEVGRRRPRWVEYQG